MKGLQVRPFVIEDTDAALAIWQRTGLPSAGFGPRSEIQKKLQHQPESFFVGLMDGRVVATVMAGYDGHRGWLYMLAVDPEFQRRGVGTAMVEAAEGWLREMGCPKVKLQVEPARSELTGFYRKLGYEMREIIDMSKVFRTSEP
ncbi:GNAT family acetyltransferase [candidate division WOR-3 bacterium]|nr:GNAT family acetyltransferase [candidate division WOR-3 bacterium]